MKRLITSLTILLLLLSVIQAQTLSQYEYWTDDNYNGRVTVEATSGEVMLSINTATQASGIHYLNFRALRSDGVWGNYCRYLYYIPTQNETVAESATVEYWIDDNYQAKATSQSTDATQTLSVCIDELASGVHGEGTLSDYAFTIDVANLETGIHTFNFRAKNLLDQWGETFTVEFELSEVTVIDQIERSDEQFDVYNLLGRKLKTCATTDDLRSLPTGIYIVNGKKILVP